MGAGLSAQWSRLLIWTCTCLIVTAHGFFLLPCENISIERKDPIVDFGKDYSQHAHVIAGSSCFSHDSTYETLTRSECCTSAPTPQDKSAYWAPMLYIKRPGPNGSLRAFSQASVSVYYKFEVNKDHANPTTRAFPPGFRMRAGNPKATSAAEGRNQRAKWHCISKDGSSQTTYNLPKHLCDLALRAEISFPSCWIKKDFSYPANSMETGQDDYSKHVAYPANFDPNGDNGLEPDCPPSHPTKLPRLFMEVWFGTSDYKPGDTFILSNGDDQGYSLHADFMNGWLGDALQNALNKCTGAEGSNPSSGKANLCFADARAPEQPNTCSKDLDLSDMGYGKDISQLPGNPTWPPPARKLRRFQHD